MSRLLPLFPLNAVLCPGLGLPLHVFEQRYRLMLRRCLERDEPFGVVLLRDGREVGPLRGQLAAVGTTALVRQVQPLSDGRMRIVTVGGRRFRIDRVDGESEPYLVGQVTYLDEPLGTDDPSGVRQLGDRVCGRFFDYLGRLEAGLGDGGPEIEVEFELEVDVSGEGDDTTRPAAGSGPAGASTEGAPAREPRPDAWAIADPDGPHVLRSTMRRLVRTDDPTALSYLLTALVQVEVAARQELLEAPDTVRRLRRLDELLAREIRLLERDLRPLILDPGVADRRRN